jgi:hypothetical protein
LSKKLIVIDDQKAVIQKYLATSEVDSCYPAWGGSIIHASQEGAKQVRAALVDAVRNNSSLEQNFANTPMIDAENVLAKLQPMIYSLFPKVERDTVLSAIAKGVVVLTPSNIDDVLLNESCSKTAWDLANLYLASVDSKPLHEDARCALGMNVGTTSYISMKYHTETDRFADYIVHETAHAFYNCKRAQLGMRETRTREFLLNVNYHQRETFAYACEVYSRILQTGKTKVKRIQLAQEAVAEFKPPDEKVDLDKFHAALKAATDSRNGWKQILQVCS